MTTRRANWRNGSGLVAEIPRDRLNSDGKSLTVSKKTRSLRHLGSQACVSEYSVLYSTRRAGDSENAPDQGRTGRRLGCEHKDFQRVVSCPRVTLCSIGRATVHNGDADWLHGFTLTTFGHHGVSHHVYRRGKGPAVVVMSEAPGITPAVTRYAARVADTGFTVYLPELVGRPATSTQWSALVSNLTNGVRVCISREWRSLAADRSSPIVDWFRALARQAHRECGGPGVGVVGMCLTGNFGLAMMLDAPVLASVLAEPSLPLALTPTLRRALHASAAEIDAAHEKIDRQGARLLGLRFQGDRLCPPERFARLRAEFGGDFESIEIADSAANPAGWGKSHSVLTEHLIDEDGQPTRAALDRTLTFLKEHLR
jgi:dienelactone hydrolase